MPPPTSLPGLQDAAAAGDPTPASARQGWTLAAMCIGLFMVMLDSTITSNATPTIQRSFDMSITQLQWVNNAYTLVTGAAVILTGRLGDMFGRKRLYTVGMVIFVVASALSGLAPSSSWLIGSRALQGLGAALLAPLSLSIINDAFPASSRGRAIGIWAAVSGLALSIGPLLGGCSPRASHGEQSSSSTFRSASSGWCSPRSGSASPATPPPDAAWTFRERC